MPRALANIPHRVTSRDGIHIYSADVPPTIWRRVTLNHAVMLFLGETGSGLARWLSPTGKLLDDLHPGDVWMIPPGLETTCEFHTHSDVFAIVVPPHRIGRALTCHAHNLAGHSRVLPLAAYCDGSPVLRDLYHVAYSQSRGLSFTDLPHSIDPINAALVLARDLWLRYYFAVRTSIGNLSADEVIDKLADD